MKDLALDMFQTCPEPCWVKCSDGRMVAVNTQYTVDFGKKLEDYVDQRDSVLWGASTASRFDENDKRALRENRAINCVEAVEVGGESIVLDVIKWPVHFDIDGNPAVFIAGKCRRHG